MSVTNRAVTAGFAGLLLLMALAGFEGLRTLRQIQNINDEIRGDFLTRTRLLERIRAGVYDSGTYVRDYLLEPEPSKAEEDRDKLLLTRRDLENALDRYRALLKGEDATPFAALTAELADYWKLLNPAFEWTSAQRKSAGYVFLRDEVFPRRVAMLDTADRIGAIAQAQLESGDLRVQTANRQFRRLLTLTIGLTMGLGVLLAAFSVREIVKLERETAQRREELQQLSARLVDAQEQERRSISRELHDEIGQSLTGVLVEMANLSTLIRKGEVDALAPKAAEIKKLLEDSIDVVRNMALLLRPPMLDDLGLVPALQWQAREISKRSDVWVKIAAERVPETLAEEVKTCVYRVVQEALHNCVQHAAAHNVRVSVREEAGRLLLSIQDDGKGFQAREERGIGLLGIEERVSHLGGIFAVESEPGHGAILRVILPLNAPAAQPIA